MKLAVLLVDAFETVDIDLPDHLVPWFTAEAKAASTDLAGLLTRKTSGLTASQLSSAVKSGVTANEYALQWILTSKKHVLNKDWELAPALDQAAPPPPPAPPALGRWRPVLWITLSRQPQTVLVGAALHLDATDLWLDLTIARRWMARTVLWSRVRRVR